MALEEGYSDWMKVAVEAMEPDSVDPGVKFGDKGNFGRLEILQEIIDHLFSPFLRNSTMD